MKALSHCYYHPRSSSVVTDRNLLDAGTVSGLQHLLTEEERYGLKFVAVCLEDGISGKLDCDSLIEALEFFGQIRDSGASPADILRELRKKTSKVAPIVRAKQLVPQIIPTRAVSPARGKVKKRKLSPT